MEEAGEVRRAFVGGVLSLVFGALVLHPVPSSAQVTVSADGPGSTYELLQARGMGMELPDCGHNVRHIREVFDGELGKHVFAFDIHRDLDDDRCNGSTDRQRLEIKTAPGSANQSTMRHTNGQTAYYRWKFKLPSGFQPSPSFTHIFQIKAQAGSDAGSPLITITPRAGSPDRMQIIFTAPSGGSGSGVKAEANLSLFRNVWVEAFVQYRSADSGNVQLTIRRLSDGVTLLGWTSGTVDMWRSGNNYNRGKWGLYRSLNNISYLRNETALFADWCISETSASQCPSQAGGGGGGGGGGGAVRFQAESMTRTRYQTNSFEGVACARATSTTLGNVRATYTGASGTRDIVVRYMDENDGAARFTVRVNGTAVGSRTANVNDHTWKTWTIAGVSVPSGAEIRVESARQSGEHARIDYVELR